MKKDFLSLKTRNITMRYYCYNPNDYNECDTAFGKERLSPFEDNEPFMEEISISKDGMTTRIKKKIIIEHTP
jgi:hypothetical protein